ncbi:DUF4906 domain-containing protein [Bacteroides helcogenes]|uniref:Major fimbrial subunit protein N-terminal domain-containing protein n=1 Tax=Bacteroides helcogenes (strain ATCC 35417 / DSM 20613 / JCM 6297 / CCUG 15421 / P 36-108) TaxID=693979 RepID=E6SNE6_BACT6|nr:DUF4906 domain-containing protein [Bacteroides helcogenes]ADV42739.1 hypothetical protein Bache_0716 [Bacteroides helcogenes P 36-108]MDY5239570.1 DUF4906 domain-containing protein [Bacteroides helcogenes]
MMKTKITIRILCMFFATLCLASCQRELLDSLDGGSMTQISIRVPNMTEITSTRSLSATQENSIYSLYFFIVEGDGTISSKKYVKLPSAQTSYSGTLDNSVMTSQSVYVVANAEFSENTFNASDLKNQMDDVTTLTQLKDIYASYADGEENYSRPQGHLLMSGYLKNPSNTNNTVILNHVDAKVIFSITLADNTPTGAEFTPTSYQIFNLPKKSYLINREQNATIADNLINTLEPYATPWDAVSCTDGNDYFNSVEDEYFNKSWDSNKKLTSTFEFYILENRKTALKTTGITYPDNYAQRDKKADGNGAFEYAHPYSTYVVIKGIYKLSNFELEQALKDGTNTAHNGMVSRYANVEYIVHLGDFGNSATPGNTDNFFTERNCSYTYNVTVKNAKNIAVEAVKNEESQPSAEGVVKDTYLAFGDMDAHFGNMLINIEIPQEEDFYTSPSKCMLASTPYTDGAPDYSWIQFAVNPVATPTTMQTYAEAKGKMIAGAKLVDFIYMLKNNPTERAKYETGGKIYFTAFIDENYPQDRLRDAYYNDFFMAGYGPTDKSVCTGMQYNGQPVDSSDPNISWKKYIDMSNRELRLFNLPYDSNDGNSHYSISQVMITQKSIQTYYDVNKTTSALGVEHLDETGILARGTTGQGSSTDGWTNTYNDLNGTTHHAVASQWNSFLNQTTLNSNVKQLTISTAAGHYAALQRNRDLNANGTIEQNEIRWYRPAKSQLISMSLSGQALRSPIYRGDMTPTSNDPGSNPSSADYRNGKKIHHSSSTNNIMTWTEEIASSGGNSEATYNPCVRTLGSEYNTVPQTYYTFDKSSRTVVFDYYKTSVLRTPIANGELIPMTEWDTSDRLPLYGLKVAQANATGDVTMKGLDNSTSPCSTYSETGTSYDAAGKWRVPNLLELAIIEMIIGDGLNQTASTNTPIMCCTKFSWAYTDMTTGLVYSNPTDVPNKSFYAGNDHHFLYYNSSNIGLSHSNYESNTIDSDNGQNHYSLRVRCVRDIQKGEQ